MRSVSREAPRRSIGRAGHLGNPVSGGFVKNDLNISDCLRFESSDYTFRSSLAARKNVCWLPSRAAVTSLCGVSRMNRSANGRYP